jgi:hypothetical protein
MKVLVNDAQLASIHSLSISASKDDMTPIISQIALRREGDNLRAMTTDRYMVLSGIYKKVEWEEWEDDEQILVDPTALKVVVDMNKRDKRHYTVTTAIVQGDDGNVFAESINESIVNLTSIVGNGTKAYPPLVRLFPTDHANGTESVNIRPDFVGKLAKVLPPEAKPNRERTWRLEFRSNKDNGKPQPVYAYYSGNEDSYKLEALIQPNTIPR